MDHGRKDIVGLAWKAASCAVLRAVGNPGRGHIVFQKDPSGGDMKAWRRQDGTENPLADKD